MEKHLIFQATNQNIHQECLENLVRQIRILVKKIVLLCSLVKKTSMCCIFVHSRPLFITLVKDILIHYRKTTSKTHKKSET